VSAPVVSEAIRAKAERLLVAGAVAVSCSERGLSAVVEGDTGTHRVTPAGGSWVCDCMARRKCSHVVAVERVT